VTPIVAASNTARAKPSSRETIVPLAMISELRVTDGLISLTGLPSKLRGGSDHTNNN